MFEKYTTMRPEHNPLKFKNKMNADVDNSVSEIPDNINNNELIIPIIKEFLTVEKDIIETGRVVIRKKVEKEIAKVEFPLVSETYHIERIPVESDLFDTRPIINEKDGNMIIPVVKEVPVTVIKYQVIEEIHVTKNHTSIPHQLEIQLQKDIVEIERTNK